MAPDRHAAAHSMRDPGSGLNKAFGKTQMVGCRECLFVFGKKKKTRPIAGVADNRERGGGEILAPPDPLSIIKK